MCHLCTGLLQVLETSHLLQLLAVLANIYTDVVRAVGHGLALCFVLFCFVGADFHSIYHCFVYESVGEVLKLHVTAIHTIDLVGEPYNAYMGLPPMEMDVCW